MLDFKMRQGKLGGSGVAAAYGEDRWGRTAFDLSAELRGEVERSEPNTQMLIGHLFEWPILQLGGIALGVPVRHDNVSRIHPVHDWAVATPDGWIVNPDGTDGDGLDAKWVGIGQRGHYGAPPDGLPNDHRLQGAFYCWFFERPRWHFVCMVGDGLPRIYTVERLDAEAEGAMVEYLGDFVRRYGAGGSERPPIGGSEQASRWLQRTFPRQRLDLRNANTAEATWLNELAYVRVKQAELTAARKELENKLKMAIGESEGLVWSGGKMTWKRTKDSVTVDYKSMAINLLYEFIKGEDERKSKMDFHTHPKPGIRRIWFDSDLFADEDAA